ncbi:MAG: pentapeptide repeat-containing protein [Nitrospirae bacterium]|nr:pentapeptide repeat-containing protein [Nitrospirota bacterium]
MNFTIVKKELNEFFKGSKEVSDGLSNVSKYLDMVVLANVPSGSLTVFGLIGGAGFALKGISSIIQALTEDDTKIPEAEDRFYITYNLLCHKAYTMAVNEVLDEYKEIHDFKITVEKIEKHKLPDLSTTETLWNYDLDISSADIKLFDVYNSYYELLLPSVDTLQETAVERINEKARCNLDFLICKKEKETEWIYNYLQLEELRKSRKAIDSMPDKIAEAVANALDGFYEKVVEHDRIKESWDLYRDYLKGLQKAEIFGSNFGIEHLYILPNYTYYKSPPQCMSSGNVIKDKKLEIKSNLPGFISHLVSKRTRSDNLIFIFGEPGIGKTSFSLMYASALAKHTYYHPVYIPLKEIDPKGRLFDEIEKYLKETELDDAVSEFKNCSNLVFILDAFDELAMATRETLGDFFRQLVPFAKNTKLRNAAFILTGRHTLFSEYDTIIPENTHVITLQPFDKGQITEWTDKWNTKTGQSFNGISFWQDDEKKKTDLHEIARQPLLLYLLSKMAEEGEAIDPANAETSISEIYRKLIDWSCKRHEALRISSSGRITMTKQEMRKFLRIAGFCTMAYGSRAIHISQLQDMLKKHGLNSENIQNKDNYEAQQTFLSAPFKKINDANWEFKHKSFGEYLAAEYIGTALDDVISKKDDKDNPGTKKWEKEEKEVSYLWADVFTMNILTTEIQRYLEPMLGNWNAFITGTPATSKEAGLKDLMERCSLIYRRFINESDMEYLASIARQYNIEPTKSLVFYGMAALFLGSLCARTLSNDESKIYFEIEKARPDGWWKMSTLIRTYFDLTDDTLSQRLFDGVSLISDEGISIPDSSTHGICLPYCRIPKIKDNYLITHTLTEAVSRLILPGAFLVKADLRGANLCSADLRGANLSGAVLREAALIGTDLRLAYLSDADLSGADLSLANLNGAFLCSAYLNRADLRGANLREVKLCEPNLGVAVYGEAVFGRAVYGRAVLKKANLSEADLRRAKFEIENILKANIEGAIFDDDVKIKIDEVRRQHEDENDPL